MGMASIEIQQNRVIWSWQKSTCYYCLCNHLHFKSVHDTVPVMPIKRHILLSTIQIQKVNGTDPVLTHTLFVITSFGINFNFVATSYSNLPHFCKGLTFSSFDTSCSQHDINFHSQQVLFLVVFFLLYLDLIQPLT